MSEARQQVTFRRLTSYANEAYLHATNKTEKRRVLRGRLSESGAQQ